MTGKARTAEELRDEFIDHWHNIDPDFAPSREEFARELDAIIEAAQKGALLSGTTAGQEQPADDR